MPHHNRPKQKPDTKPTEESLHDVPTMEDLAELGALVSDAWQLSQTALDGKQPFKRYMAGFRVLTGTAWLAKPGQKNGRTGIVEINKQHGYWEVSSYSVQGLKRLLKHPGATQTPIHKDIYPLMQGEPVRQEVYAAGKDGMPDRLLNSEEFEPLNASQCQIMQEELREVLQERYDTAAHIGSIAV
jgi:hypothetical protein